MLYLARKLHLPSGELIERYVIRTDGDTVLSWEPFEAECQSMIFVDEILLSYNPGLRDVLNKDDVVCASYGRTLCMYEIKSDGEMVKISI